MLYPPRFDRPLAWISRDHRKTIIVDSHVAFVTGLCVGQMWVGDPGKQLDPWRDTVVQLSGPAVADVEAAFAEAWATAGDRLPVDSMREAPALSGTCRCASWQRFRIQRAYFESIS